MKRIKDYIIRGFQKEYPEAKISYKDDGRVLLYKKERRPENEIIEFDSVEKMEGYLLGVTSFSSNFVRQRFSQDIDEFYIMTLEETEALLKVMKGTKMDEALMLMQDDEHGDYFIDYEEDVPFLPFIGGLEAIYDCMISDNDYGLTDEEIYAFNQLLEKFGFKKHTNRNENN